MNESLLDMIKQGTKDNIVPSKHIEELVPLEKKDETLKENVEKSEVVTQPIELPLISLSDWFIEYAAKIQSVRIVKVVAAGVNSKKSIVVTVPETRGEKDSTSEADSRELMVIKKCLAKQVVNLPPWVVDVFDHDILRIIYQCDDHGIFIKSYCLKNGLINVFCLQVGNQLVPYGRDRLRKGSKIIKVPIPDFTSITNKLKESADVQRIHLLYKQVEKQMESIKTNFEAVSWLNSRQEGVIDVNHLMQLDDTIIYIMSN